MADYDIKNGLNNIADSVHALAKAIEKLHVHQWSDTQYTDLGVVQTCIECKKVRKV